MTYAEKLKDPRWQKKRLEIMQRDNFTCRYCGSKDKSLVVHHVLYEHNMEPWEYDGHKLMTLCEECHSIFHNHNEILEINIETITNLLRGGHFYLLTFQIVSLLFERIKGNGEYTIPTESQCKIKKGDLKILKSKTENGKTIH